MVAVTVTPSFIATVLSKIFLLGYHSTKAMAGGGSTSLYAMFSMVKFLDHFARSPGKCASVYSDQLGHLRDVKFSKYFQENLLLDLIRPIFKESLVAAAVRKLVNKHDDVTVSSLVTSQFKVRADFFQILINFFWVDQFY